MLHHPHTFMLPLAKEDIKRAIAKTQAQPPHPDHQRNRHPNVAFDDSLRSHLSEVGIHNWFDRHNLPAHHFEHVDDTLGTNLRFDSQGKQLHLATSLQPDIDPNFDHTLQNRHMYIPVEHSSVDRLQHDIYMQVMSPIKRKLREAWLANQHINLDTDNLDYLYNALGGRDYQNSLHLVGWVDKRTLAKQVQSLPHGQRTWGFGQRVFWHCPLSGCRAPEELITHLQQ